jgi:hypothetical protein
MPTINDKTVMACYVMEPDGLVFSAPVSVHIILPFSGNTTPMPLLFSKSQGVSLLDNVRVFPTKPGSTVTIEGEISHFSELIVNKQGPFILSLENPTNVLTGLPFELRAKLTPDPDFRNMMIKEKRKAGEGTALYGEDSQVYWVSFLSCRYDCSISEQGITNHISPHEVKISGPEIMLDGTQSTQQIPITIKFDAIAPSNGVEINCRLVMDLKTESRSVKYEFPKQKNVTFSSEISSTFTIKNPWVSGKYIIRTSATKDTSIYAPLIRLATVLTSFITVNDSQITIIGNGNWVTVKGQVESNGQFVATGRGMVGFNSGTAVELRGRFTGYMAFEAEYTVGSGEFRVIYVVTGRSATTSSGAQVSKYPLYSSGGFLSFFESVGWIRTNSLIFVGS